MTASCAVGVELLLESEPRVVPVAAGRRGVRVQLAGSGRGRRDGEEPVHLDAAGGVSQEVAPADEVVLGSEAVPGRVGAAGAAGGCCGDDGAGGGGAGSAVASVGRSRIASRTAIEPAQTRLAPSMWAATRATGRWVKYWTKPIRPCDSSITSRIRAARAAPEACTARKAKYSATVRPTSRKTRSAWAWAMAAGSRPLRLAPLSPECGPLPVTTTPRTMTPALAKVITVVRWRRGAGTRKTGAPSPSTVDCHSA